MPPDQHLSAGSTFQNIGRSSSEPLVPIRLSLLTKLRECQGELESHILAYMTIYQVQRICDRVRVRIEKGLRELHRLDDPDYWENLRDLLQDAQRSVPYAGRQPGSDNPLENILQLLLEGGQKATQAANDVLSAPEGTSKEDALRVVQHRVEEMLQATESALRQSRSGAEKALADIKMCSERILERAMDQTEIPRLSTSGRIIPVETRLRSAELSQESRTGLNRRLRFWPETPSEREETPLSKLRDT